ncbi:MAG: DUF4910 domain-containing protein [Symbiobacteriia bacterium]
MFGGVLRTIRGELSGQLALANVAEIVQHHRIPGYKGQRDAVLACTQILTGNGVQAEAVSYPADGKTMFWAEQTAQGWECDAAELWVVSPEKERRRIANFREMPISIMQGSAPTPPGGVEADLVVVARPEEEASYEGLDLAGKMVLVGTCDMIRARELAVEKYGAIGIVTDRMPEWVPVRGRMDLPDSVHWNGFHWTGHEKRCFGFAVSPRTGDWLRKLENPRLFAKVESRFTASTFMNVEAFIPGQAGEPAEEIVVIAHLCHPKPSANDNASGSGTAMEVARTLQKLIDEGQLPRPKRGIRFLLVPEFLGTYAYLSTHADRIPGMLAGINLDMVGENQELCGSALQVERPSQAVPGYVGDLTAMILHALADDASNFFGTAKYALFRHTVTSFSGGSDHWILSDPTVGVPSPMLIQWPDLHYHTSSDTLDKVDPKMLHRVGTITATYAHFLANAGFAEVRWLASEIAAGFGPALHDALARELANEQGAGSPEDLAEFHLASRIRDLKALAAYVEPERRADYLAVVDDLSREMRRAATSQVRIAGVPKGIAEAAAAPAAPNGSTVAPAELAKRAGEMVPQRVYRGPAPLGLRGFLHLLTAQEREDWRLFNKAHPDGSKIDSLLLYWADGRRNLLDIARQVQLETGYFDLEFAVRYMEVLQKLGLIRVTPSAR